MTNKKIADFLKYIFKNYIQVRLYEQDGYYWLRIGNDSYAPMPPISKEEYEMLKEWLEYDK